MKRELLGAWLFISYSSIALAVITGLNYIATR
jgi:hypothetical protein